MQVLQIVNNAPDVDFAMNSCLRLKLEINKKRIATLNFVYFLKER